MPGSPVAYPGINPLTINTSGAGGPGVVVNDTSHGLFTVPLVVQGNNDVTAGNIAAADQGEQNSLNWLGWRTIDWIAGGTWTWTAQVNMSNALVMNGDFVMNGPQNVLGNGGTLYIGYPLLGNGAVVVSSGSSVTANSGSTWEYKSGSSVTFDAGASLLIDAGATYQVGAPLVHTGTTGVSVLRDVAATSLTVTAGGSGGHFVADAANTFDPTQADMIGYDASGNGADRIWTLSEPASGGAVKVLFYPTSTSTLPHNVFLKDSGGTTLIEMGPGGASTQQSTIDLYYSTNLGRWILGPNTHP
jgi:hypothetical protein